jgi:hypothetical protein
MTARHAFRAGGAVRATPSRDSRHFGALRRLGYDVDALLASSGLHRSIVEDPTPTFRAAWARESWQCAAPATDHQPAAQAGRRNTDRVRNPLLDYLIVSSDSVGETFGSLAACAS